MNNVSRRRFLRHSAVVVGGAAVLRSVPMAAAAETADAGTALLPWQREATLRDSAKSVTIKHRLDAHSAAPAAASGMQGNALQVSSLAMRSTLWGPSHRVTVSMLKNDVWDRRVTQASYPTVKEVVANAMAPGAAAYKGIDSTRTTRPNWHMLMSDGTMEDPLRTNRKALMKATGQMIFAMDELEGAPQPELSQSCADGVVSCVVRKDRATARLEYVLSMTQNVWAVRGTWNGLRKPVSLRLYRHNEEGDIDAPVAQTDGRYFWVRQQLPAEKTFPKGFSVVMMGLMGGAESVAVTAANGGADLGTPSPDAMLRRAAGSAATATFEPADDVPATFYVAVVTTVDAAGGDVLAEARRRVDAAAKMGFGGVAESNAAWYGELYDRRERGRIFHGDAIASAGKAPATEDISEVFTSWACQHGGGTKTDMRKFQASAHYCVPELARQPYSGLPCYNEIFYTHAAVRGRSDSTDMWLQLVEHWRESARQNAHDVFSLPGMYMTHGFLPPIKADVYIHTNFALEFAVDTLAQIVKPTWDEWDYGGDEAFLRNTCYPIMRDVSLFYAGYVSQGGDGKYHVSPCIQEECWGFYPGLSHNRDCIAAIATFRWAFLRTIEAARLLGVDAGLIPRWQEIADHLPAYPTWDKPEGRVFAGLPGVEPFRFRGDHPWDVGSYPTVLTDDINLDSDEATKATMLRTVTLLRGGGSNEAMVLLGQPPKPKPGQSVWSSPENTLSVGYGVSPERLINSRSGRIHLFPALASEDATAFRRMQTRRGFLVSACRRKEVTYVEIEARRAATCEIMNPWPGQKVEVRLQVGRDRAGVASRLDVLNGECVVFAAHAGETYELQRA